MNHTKQKTALLRLNRHLLTITLILTTLAPTLTKAQHSTYYQFYTPSDPVDVKHYATAEVPSGGGETVMAGTIHDLHNGEYGSSDKVHFMRLDDNGNILATKMYDFP